jgi:hypothetical protein
METDTARSSNFSADGELIGVFCDDERVSDPRGLCVHPTSGFVYLNSGDNRILAVGQDGAVCLDSGRIEGLDPGGGMFGPDGRYYITVRTQGTKVAFPASLDHEGTPLLPERAVPFPRGFGFGPNNHVYLSSGIDMETWKTRP